ncbi:hypothetical protein [Actinocrispum wychmicini]|uniref:hypothetical protein n=1 Tax=Actinocrispum wychmicini TaxID=1213861 RepID=UPI00104B6FAA|nr:hypothetical protein [Actinocrispum wychmicini]
MTSSEPRQNDPHDPADDHSECLDLGRRGQRSQGRRQPDQHRALHDERGERRPRGPGPQRTRAGEPPLPKPSSHTDPATITVPSEPRPAVFAY